MNRRAKRLLALFLVLTMCISLFPVTAIAEGEPEQEPAVTEQAPDPVAETEPAEEAEPALSELPEGGETEALPPAADEPQDETPSNQCGDDLFWSFDEGSGTLTISGSGRMYDYARQEDDDDMPIPPFSLEETEGLPAAPMDEGDSLPASPFAELNVRKVVCEEGVESIGSDALFHQVNLSEVHLPSTITDVASGAFAECFELKCVYYSGTHSQWNDVSIGTDNSYLSQATVVCSGDAADGSCGNNLTWTLQDGTLVISGSGFLSYWNLGDSPWAASADSVHTVVLRSGVAGLSGWCFADCSNLTKFIVEDGNTSFAVNYGVLYSRDMSRLVRFPCGLRGYYSVPDSVTEIADYAFANCIGLATIEAEDEGLPILDDHLPPVAMRDNNSDPLVLTIPMNLQRIGGYAFSFCGNLTSVLLQEGVTIIDERAFANCANLSSITMPLSLTEIGPSAFSNTALTQVTFAGTISQWRKIAVNTGNVDLITARVICTDGEIEGSSEIIASGECGADGDNMFWYLGDNGRLTILGCGGMRSFSSIDPWAEYRDSITEVILPEEGYSIGELAFKNCVNLTSISFPSIYFEVSREAFWGCSSLTELHFLSEAPSFEDDTVFVGVTATAYYPYGDETWTEEVRQNYGGNITWAAEGGPAGPAVIAYGNCGDDLTWTVDAEGVLTVSGSGDMWDWTVGETVPWSEHTRRLTSIVIEPGVTSIGGWSFLFTTINSLTIPDTVTRIGNSAFLGCSGLTSLALPAGLESIGDYAFGSCSGLSTVTLPESLTVFGEGAFRDCSSLTEILTPEGNNAFTSRDGILYTQEMSCLVQCPAGKSGVVSIPEGVTSIKGFAFFGCSALTGVTLPASLTSIGNTAFYECSALTGVTLPESLTSIGNVAFVRCGSLTSITIPASVTSIGDWAFEGCWGLTEVHFEGDAPNFGDDVFSEVTATAYYPTDNDTWTDEVRQNYGGNITWVAEGGPADPAIVASGSCGDDLSWTLDENGLLTVSGTGDMWAQLGEGPAWWEHTGEIKAVLVGEDVTSIRFSAFYYCENLTTATILSAAQIGEDAFSYCPKLLTVHYGGTVETWKQFRAGCDRYTVTVFCSDGTIQPAPSSQCGEYLTWSVESGTLTIRGAGPMWNYSGNDMPWTSEQFTAIEVEEGVTSIGDCAFSYFQYSGSVTSLLLPDSLLSIGNNAFVGCSNLSDVIIPEGVTSIGGWAFSPSENARISVPVSVTSIGDRAFGVGCPLDIDYGGTVTQWKALAGPQTVSPYYATVHCLDGVIPAADFCRCGDDLTWTLENGVLTVRGTGEMWPSPAWYADSSNIGAIYSVFLDEGVTSVGERAFENFGNLQSLSLPSTLTRIDASAFSCCSQLQTVVFPAGLERIGKWAFLGCSLTELRFYGSAPELQTGALGLGQDAVIYYPAGDESWTEELRQQYTATWIPFDARYLATGECGDDLTWTLGFDGLLTISGTGPMWETDGDVELWNNWRNKIQSVQVEEGVTTLRNSAFYFCKNLETVSLPSTLTDIGFFAFGQAGLREIRIPAGVNSIGFNCFWNCGNLERIEVDEGNQSFSSDNGILYDKTMTRLVICPPGLNQSTLVIPSGVTSIGEEAFVLVHDLRKLTLPATLSSLESGALASGDSLQSVVFTGPAPAFADNVFSCVTATVYYPAGDDSWNDVVGQNYGGSLTWHAGEPTVYSGQCGDDLTWTLDETGLLTISGVGEMWDYVGGEENSPPWLREHGSKVKAIRIENGVTSIGRGAFAVGYYGMSPTSIELPDTLERIGNGAFWQNWPGALTLPDGLKEIGDSAFGLSAVSGYLRIPGSVERIGSNAFRDCAITGVTLEDGVLEIGDEAFCLCSALAEARVPSSVESMGKSVFFGCCSLATVCYSGTVAEWQALAPKAVEPHITGIVCSDGTIPLADKYQCGDDLTWSLNDGVLTISGTGEMWDFSRKYVQGCYVTTAPWGAEAANIRELQITEGVSSVGDYAFYGLRQLSSAVSLPPSVTSIGRFAFYESAVSRLTIPHGVTTIGDLAVAGIPELQFEGPAPVIEGGLYNATVYYPAWEPSWAEEIQKDIYYNVTWIAVGPIAIGDCGESLHWRLSDDGVLTIYGSGDMDNYARGEAPWYAYREQIVSLVLEEGVSSVGDYAFADLAVLSSVEAEEENPGVDPNLLRNTAALNSIETPESLRRIGEGAFAGCTALEELTIPAGVESIGEGAFRECPALEAITFEGSAPEGVGCLDGVSAAVVFPAEDPSWTEELKQSYGGTPVWITDISVSEDTFPDPSFRSYLLEHVDSDGDGQLSAEELLAVTSIDLSCTGVASLEGIENFPNLEELNAGGDFETAGQLTSVDLSANTKLKSLNLGFNPLGELDVSMLPELESLMVGFCGLSELDLSGNGALKELWCDNNNLTALDLSANPLLEHLDCCGNEGLTELDLRPCPTLVEVYKAGGRHISWMQGGLPELYESIWVYGGTGDDDYMLAVNSWTEIIAEDPPSHIPGDINGDGKLNNKDITRLQKYLKGDTVEVNAAALDVNGDGKVNNKDLTRLQKYLKGDDVELH